MVNLLKVIVIIATVQRRTGALTRCLNAIRLQTRKPDELHLLPDDYKNISKENLAMANLATKRLIVSPSRVPIGPGCRWLHIDKNILDDEAIVISIDDDICPNRQYIQKTVDWMLRLGGVVCWNLWNRRSNGYIPTNGIGGGLCALRAKHVRGIGKAPLVKKYFIPGYTDIILSSYIMSRKIPIWSVNDASMDWSGHFQGIPTTVRANYYSEEFKSFLRIAYQAYGVITGWGLNPQRPVHFNVDDPWSHRSRLSKIPNSRRTYVATTRSSLPRIARKRRRISIATRIRRLK